LCDPNRGGGPAKRRHAGATYSHDLGAADFEVLALPSVETRIFSD
jgi:hypothetical protein